MFYVELHVELNPLPKFLDFLSFATKALCNFDLLRICGWYFSCVPTLSKGTSAEPLTLERPGVLHGVTAPFVPTGADWESCCIPVSLEGTESMNA